MNLSLNIILNQLRDLHLEVHSTLPSNKSFCRCALLPRNYEVMRDDLLHICRLSDALRASAASPGKYYLCIRDRITDSVETEEALQGMVIVNENMDIELLLSKVQDIFNQVSEWYQEMQSALIHEKSLQTILDISEHVIGNTINISDSAFTLLACTQNIQPDDEISLALREFGYHPESTLQMFRQQHRFEVWEQSQSLIINTNLTLSKYVLVNKVFRFRNTYFTHVVMVCDHHPLSDGLLELFGMLTDILAIYAERNWKDKNALSHNYDSFLFDLLSGTLTNPKDIQERARYLGLRTDGRFQLVKLAVEPGMEAALGRVGRELADLLPSAQVLLYQQAVLALLRLRSNGSLGIPQEHILHFLSRHQAKGGISNSFTGLENLSAAYVQASLALKYNADLRGSALVSSLLPVPELPLLCSFQDRVLHSLLGEHPDNKQIWSDSIYYRGLKSLYDYDCQHGTNNLQLLRAYLWNERKATETGQQLHMHRNNVIYRIGRIEKMMELELSDHGTRLGLEMSFLLLELYGFPDPESAEMD